MEYSPNKFSPYLAQLAASMKDQGKGKSDRGVQVPIIFLLRR